MRNHSAAIGQGVLLSDPDKIAKPSRTKAIYVGQSQWLHDSGFRRLRIYDVHRLSGHLAVPGHCDHEYREWIVVEIGKNGMYFSEKLFNESFRVIS